MLLAVHSELLGRDAFVLWLWLKTAVTCIEKDTYLEGQQALASWCRCGGRLGRVGGLGGLSAYTSWVVSHRIDTYLVLFPWWVKRPPCLGSSLSLNSNLFIFILLISIGILGSVYGTS